MTLSAGSSLAAHVERIDVTELDGEENDEANGAGVPRSEAHLFVHVFKLSNVGDCICHNNY